MSTLDTDAIAQRLKAATPGPWTSDQFGEIAHKEMAIGRVFLADDFPCLDPEDDEDLARLEAEFAANAVLVASAPGDIAALLAEVARLKREITELTICDCGRRKSAAQCPSCDREVERA